MPRFRIHHLVAFEFLEVQAWYAGLSVLAAENFDHHFHAALDRVRQHPTGHAPWRPPFRRVRLPRFPYLILFHADAQQISILALVHKCREPDGTFATLARRKSELG